MATPFLFVFVTVVVLSQQLCSANHVSDICETKDFGPTYLWNITTKDTSTYNMSTANNNWAVGQAPLCFFPTTSSCYGKKYRFSIQGRHTKGRLSCVEKEVRAGLHPTATGMNFYTGFADLNADGYKDLIVGGCYKTTADAGDPCDQKYRYFVNQKLPGGRQSATDPTFHNQTSTPFDNINVMPNDVMAFADIDSDGDVDMLVTRKHTGATSKSLYLYKNKADLGSVASYELMTGYNDPFANVMGLDSPIAAFGDCDSDGDPDLVIGLRSGSQKILYFQNTGEKVLVNGTLVYNFTFDELTRPRPFENPPYAGNPFWGFNNLGTIGSHAPTLGDVDNDGDVDVVIGVAGEMTISSGAVNSAKQRLMYLENTGSATNPTFTYRKDQDDIFYGYEEIMAFDAGTNVPTSYPKPNLVDFDADGDLDLLVGTSGGLLYFEFGVGTDVYEVGAGTVNDLLYENTRSVNPFAALSILSMHADASGNQFATVAFVDMDNDDDLDAVVASKDRVTYLKNTGTKIAPVYTLEPGFFPWTDCYYCSVAAGDINGDDAPDIIIGTANDARSGSPIPQMKLLYFKNQGNSTSPHFSSTAESSDPFPVMVQVHP